jgi:phosphatidylethanolamine/phosphatidyl-N-methylethanolamine N-methyltransferase
MISARKKIAARFDEEVRFFKGWMDRPKAVGSVVPTSSVTARRMASVIDIDSGLPVLELGPGTGVITRAIVARGVKPQDLYSVEYSGAFVQQLRGDFPGVNIIEGDAFDLNGALGKARNIIFDSVVSAVPMLNFPVAKRIELVDELLNRVPAGRPVVQLTYGPLSPVPVGKGDYTVKHFDFVLRNLPPAQLWIYSRATNG